MKNSKLNVLHINSYYQTNMKNDEKIIDKSCVIPNGIDNFWIENKY